MADTTNVDGSVHGSGPEEGSSLPRSATAPAAPAGRKRGLSNAIQAVTEETTTRLRSVTNKVLEANVPVGMWSATGNVVASAPTPLDIRRGDHVRRESDASSSRPRDDSQSSAIVPGQESEKRASRSTSSPQKLAKIPDLDDGLPEDVFGRPELEDQSYVRGQRASVISQRIPKLAVRGQPSTGDTDALASSKLETFQDAMESQQAVPTRPEPSRVQSTEPFPDLDDDSDFDELDPKPKRKSKNVDAMLGRAPPTKETVITEERQSSETGDIAKPVPNDEGVYPNGYSFPKKKPWGEAFKIGFMGFLRFTFTPTGFLIVLYGLNVVAWGGMLFLLLCNASPAMCTLGDGTYDCNNINSPRRVWVEIDSQILNALFCVTGFGLIPWRFRDLYYLLKWRLGKHESGLRKLGGYHNGWFRLPHSDHLDPVKDYRESHEVMDEANVALPLPLKKTPAPPLTGARAVPTALWKLDFVIWAFVWNTFLQLVLSVFMWRLNRYDRPSWSTGLFVALACIVAACGGLMQFLEGKKIKSVEGVPLEVVKQYEDIEQNNSKNKTKDDVAMQEIPTTNNETKA